MTKRTIDVPLSTGQTVTVGVMNWAGYVTLKNRIVSLLGGQAGRMIAEFLTAEQAPKDWVSAATTATPLLLKLVNDAIDAATPALIMASTPESFRIEELGPSDILDLRAAAIEVNDVPALMEREKNFLAATFGGLLSQIPGSSLTLPASFGGPSGNPS